MDKEQRVMWKVQQNPPTTPPLTTPPLTTPPPTTPPPTTPPLTTRPTTILPIPTAVTLRVLMVEHTRAIKHHKVASHPITFPLS